MDTNQQRKCPRCGTTNYGVMHSCLKCGAPLAELIEDVDTIREFQPPNRFEAPTILDKPPEPSAFIEVIGGEDTGNRYAISPGITFGRSKNCDIVIDSPKASREHARIEQNEYQQWLLVDLGSTNGTLHNNKRVVKPSVLYNGDEIQIGEFHFKVTIKKPYHEPTPPDLAAPPPPVVPEKQPLQPLPPRKGCASNTALIIGVAVVMLICLCGGIYLGYTFLEDQGLLNLF